jgi:hypothetical protein
MISNFVAYLGSYNMLTPLIMFSLSSVKSLMIGIIAASKYRNLHFSYRNFRPQSKKEYVSDYIRIAQLVFVIILRCTS